MAAWHRNRVAEVETMAELICEGRCNPQVATVDQMVTNDLRRFGYRDTRVTVMPGTVDALGGLRHTEHIHQHGAFWACVDCGAARRWGY